MLIRTAFCFDENLVNQIRVTVASLLDSNEDAQVHYEIYCICTRAAMTAEEPLRKIVAARDEQSRLHMRCIDNPYEDSYKVRGITAGTYLRLLLHRLLPEADKVIYTDVDVFFRGSLRAVWEAPIGGCVLAGVASPVNLSDKWEWNSDRPYWHHLADMKGKYINAGVTLMNLAEIRSRGLEEQWNRWAKERLYYQDQDILNITCKGAIYYLPPKYNMLAYMSERLCEDAVAEQIYTAAEYKEALEDPVIIHYAADKPWKRYDTKWGYLWWDYVNSQPDLAGLFDEEKARRYHGPTFFERAVRKIRKIVSKEKL